MRLDDTNPSKENQEYIDSPRKYSALGRWCNTMRYSYNKMQQGQTSNFNFTQDHIMRLEEIGFKWKIMVTFEQRCRDLEAFKSEFGHCNAP